MTQQSGNILHEVRSQLAADQRDQMFLATVTAVNGSNVTIRRPGQSADEGPYVAVSGLTVNDADVVVVCRVGQTYLVLALIP